MKALIDAILIRVAVLIASAAIVGSIASPYLVKLKNDLYPQQNQLDYALKILNKLP